MRAVSAGLQCVSEEQNLRSADIIADIYAQFSGSRCERARQNIRRAFPGIEESEVNRITKESLRYMFRLFLVDSLMMPQLVTPNTWHRHVELGDFESELELMSSDKPALLIGAHCGNWEILGFTMSVLGFPMTALARPLDNPLLDQWVLGLREARGMRILTKWGATSEIETLMKSDNPRDRRLGFVADQNAGANGLFVPFLGKLASSYKSIGLLAMRYKLPVVVGYAPRKGNQFKYRLDVVDRFGPEDWESQKDPLFYITARFNHGIEEMVRRDPEQYLWIHRRWKSRPKWELQGKEMPASLRSRLESLPWMTQEQLNQILDPNPHLAPQS